MAGTDHPAKRPQERLDSRRSWSGGERPRLAAHSSVHPQRARLLKLKGANLTAKNAENTKRKKLFRDRMRAPARSKRPFIQVSFFAVYERASGYHIAAFSRWRGNQDDRRVAGRLWFADDRVEQNPLSSLAF